MSLLSSLNPLPSLATLLTMPLNLLHPPHCFLPGTHQCLPLSPNHALNQKKHVPWLDQAKYVPSKQPRAVEANVLVAAWLVGPTAWRPNTSSLQLFLPWRHSFCLHGCFHKTSKNLLLLRSVPLPRSAEIVSPAQLL